MPCARPVWCGMHFDNMPNDARPPFRRYKEVCIEQTKLCCPKGKFGKTCKSCPGGTKTPCNGHGECKGSGSRSGTGKCKCNSGYSGKKCSKCKKEGLLHHYRKGTAADDTFTCEKCDAGCAAGCEGPGPEFCKGECSAGYEAVDMSGVGCKDIDECAAGTFIRQWHGLLLNVHPI